MRVAEVAARLRASGQRGAARVVERLPARGGVLDAAALDALMVRVHCELQRLSEELVQGRRALEVLDGLVARLDGLSAGGGRVRIVDVGCGLGYLLRWLAAHPGLTRWGERVELVGVDLDAALVGEARRLAALEALAVRFETGDAFAPGGAVADPARTVVVSSGLLHHVPAPDLPGFFAAQAELGVGAFCHWDPVPGPLTTLGAWVFHRARMREPVSRHDGVLSVRRAHPVRVLADAARTGAPAYDVTGAGRSVDVLHAVVGVRR